MEWIEINEDSIRYFHFKWVAIIKIYWMIKEQKAWTINDNNNWRCNKLWTTIFIFETRLWRIENRCRINEPVQFFIAYGVLQLLIHGFCCQCIDISVSFHSFKWGTVGDIENPLLLLKIQRHQNMNSWYLYDGFALKSYECRKILSMFQ